MRTKPAPNPPAAARERPMSTAAAGQTLANGTRNPRLSSTHARSALETKPRAESHSIGNRAFPRRHCLLLGLLAMAHAASATCLASCMRDVVQWTPYSYSGNPCSGGPGVPYGACNGDYCCKNACVSPQNWAAPALFTYPGAGVRSVGGGWCCYPACSSPPSPPPSSPPPPCAPPSPPATPPDPPLSAVASCQPP